MNIVMLIKKLREIENITNTDSESPYEYCV